MTERLDVYLCDRLAGTLERTDGRISFRYLAEYLESGSPAVVSSTLPLSERTYEERDVMAHFKNPSMPSVAVTADAAVKLAVSRPSFGSTDVFLEMSGFDQADIRRIKAQEARARGLQLLTEELNDAD